MDWESLYCPNRHCRVYGIPFGQSVLVKNGTSHGQKQALCRACGRSVTMRYGTAYEDLNADPLLFETAITARWQKEIRCAVRRGLWKLTRIRRVTG